MENRGPYLVTGTAEDVAQALMDGKPVSEGLGALYARVLRKHLAKLAMKYLKPEPEPEPEPRPSAVVLPFRR